MRKIPTWQTTRRVFTATALAAFLTGGAFLTAGTASAATTLAPQCTNSVTGSMGDTVAIEGSVVKELVRQGAQSQVNVLTFATVWPDSLADTIAGKGALAIGKIPESAGGTIPGSDIGATVANALKGASGLGLLPGTQQNVLNAISQKVAQNCGLTTVATNYAPPSSSTAPATGGQTGTYGGSASGTDSLGNLLPNTGSAPKRDYTGIPTATPGIGVAPGVRYPANGTLPGDASAPAAGARDGQGGPNPDVRTAGNAEALSADSGAAGVQLPMLLAVIVLAGVTAGLVRTWVLRRAS